MTPTIIESPYAGNVARNMLYLELCIRDSALRGEAPYASHKMMTAALDDHDPDERALGIAAGMAWRRAAGNRVFCVDFGWSSWMRYARQMYDREGLACEERILGQRVVVWVDRNAGRWPPVREWPVGMRDA